MKYYIYILYSETRDRYYIGSSEDIQQRLQRHNQGATKSTKSGRPWIIVYSEEFNNKTDSLKRENQIKKMKSRIYIESLIEKD